MHVNFLRLSVTGLALSIATISCGGGGDAMGGNSSTRLSDEAFCAKIAALNNETSGDASSPQAMLDSLDLLKDMAKVAPTAELQQAIEAFTPLLEEMAKLDENDPEAFSTMFGQLFNPELIKATEVLEAYSTDVCGIVNNGE